MNTKIAAGIWDATKAFIKSQPRPATAIAGGVVGGTVGGAVTDEKNTGKGVAVGAIAGAAAGWAGGKKLVSNIFKETDNAATTVAPAAGQQTTTTVPVVDAAAKSNKISPEQIQQNLSRTAPDPEALPTLARSKKVAPMVSLTLPPTAEKKTSIFQRFNDWVSSKFTKNPKQDVYSGSVLTRKQMGGGIKQQASPGLDNTAVVGNKSWNYIQGPTQDSSDLSGNFYQVMSRQKNQSKRRGMVHIASLSKASKGMTFGRQLFQSAYASPRITTGIAGGVLGATSGGIVSEDTGKGMLIGGTIGATAGALGGQALKDAIISKSNPLFGKDIRKSVMTNAGESKAAITEVTKKVKPVNTGKGALAPESTDAIPDIPETIGTGTRQFKGASYNLQSVLGGRLSSDFSTNTNKGIRRATAADKLIGVKSKVDATLANELQWAQQNLNTMTNQQKSTSYFNIKHLKEVQDRLAISIDRLGGGAVANISQAAHSPQARTFIRQRLKGEYVNDVVESITRVKNTQNVNVINPMDPITNASAKLKILKYGLPLAAAGVAGAGFYLYNKKKNEQG